MDPVVGVVVEDEHAVSQRGGQLRCAGADGVIAEQLAVGHAQLLKQRQVFCRDQGRADDHRPEIVAGADFIASGLRKARCCLGPCLGKRRRIQIGAFALEDDLPAFISGNDTVTEPVLITGIGRGLAFFASLQLLFQRADLLRGHRYGMY